MPRFFYRARSLKGELKSGIQEAKDVHELARDLREQGYFLIEANLKTDSQKRKIEISIPFLERIGLKEKMFFTRNLRVMIRAGVSLPRALGILAEQSRNKKFRNALLNISEEITKGKTFSQALAHYPSIFSEIYQNMIKVAEESGTLEDVLDVLSQQMEREYELKSKIQGALIYPAVIICAMFAIGFLMLVMVVPKLAETFKELNTELPATTKLVIFLGTFLAEKWYLAILIIIVFLIFARTAIKTKTGKKVIDFLILKIPIISGIIKEANSAYTTRTLSSLIRAGVPIVRSLEIVSGALSNFYFKKTIIETAEKVRKGEKLSQAIKDYKEIYPPLVLEMMKVGEETGETSAILAHLADFYEEEVTTTTKNLSSIIEPILMLLIGSVVGFFAISMIQPIYSMLGAIK